MELRWPWHAAANSLRQQVPGFLMAQVFAAFKSKNCDRKKTFYSFFMLQNFSERSFFVFFADSVPFYFLLVGRSMQDSCHLVRFPFSEWTAPFSEFQLARFQLQFRLCRNSHGFGQLDSIDSSMTVCAYNLKRRPARPKAQLPFLFLGEFLNILFSTILPQVFHRFFHRQKIDVICDRIVNYLWGRSSWLPAAFPQAKSHEKIMFSAWPRRSWPGFFLCFSLGGRTSS